VNRLLVCFPLRRFELGGLERVQMLVASGLIMSGFQVNLVTRKLDAQAESLLKPNVPVLVLGGRRSAFLYRLFQWLRKTRPEVIVTSANDIGCMVLLLRFLFWRDSRVVWAQHLSVSGPLLASKGVRRIRLLIERSFMRLLIKYADGVIAVSEAVAEDMRLQINSGLPIQVIYNPVIFKEFEQKSKEAIEWLWPDHTVPTVIFVGRLVPVKRLDLLIRAFAKCVQVMPARLLIVGDGPEASRAEKMVAELNLREACRFLGYCRNPLPWIRQADLLVLSSDAEGFGVVLVEAMACGTQVVSTDCLSGPAEVLGRGRYGRLVPVNDADALAAAMLASLRSPFVEEVDLKKRAAEFSAGAAVSQYEEMLRYVEKGMN